MSSTPPIQHSIERRGRHELRVKTTFPFVLSEVRIPMWRPGRYERGDFGQRVRNMSQCIDGKWTPLSKSGLHTWKCMAPEKGQDAVELRFDYTACKMDAGNTWSDDQLLYVNPVNLMPHHPDWANHPVEVHLTDVPSRWKLATALNCTATSAGPVLHANGTQHLMDSPWIAAPETDLWHDTYTVNGHVFHVHVWGKRHYDDKAFVHAHERFTAAQMKAFGWLPCPDYHFLYLFPDGPARHGVEHEASTVIAWGPAKGLTHDNGQASPGLEEVIDIASHELVHTWNVKWLRPEEWMPYNFDQPSPSRLGYVAEGVTTYLGDLFLLECGVIDMEGWLRRFEKLLTRHLWNPGRLETSVADSSYDTWLDGYILGVPHRRGNIYVEGAVLAFLCDVALNRAGGGWLVDAVAELASPSANRSLDENTWWSTLARRASARGPEGAQDILDLRSAHCDGTDDTWPALVDALLYQGIQATLRAHSDPLARCGALCGKGREGRIEVKVCWPNSPAWKIGMRHGDVVSSHKEVGDQLHISWLRDTIHLEENSIAMPSDTGHFSRPSLEVLPG